MKQLQEKLLALLLMALLTGTGAYAQEASDKQKTPDYRFAVRTNVLYDAFLLPTLGVEWRMNENVGIKLDGSLAWWGGNHGKVQKMWLVNPEVRWYLLREKRFYVGASGTYGEYNIYKYPLGSILLKDTGYQGKPVERRIDRGLPALSVSRLLHRLQPRSGATPVPNMTVSA